MKDLLILVVSLAAFCLGNSSGATAHSGESFDQLMVKLQRYGSTPLLRQEKAEAKAELFRRGGTSLHDLVTHAHIRNMWIHVYTEQLVRELKANEAVPVLLDLLTAERAECRKMAAYWLWQYDAPEHADKLFPLLDDPYTAGAAMRTLGKWRCRNALARIMTYLQDDDERRRIAAANALRDIGDPEAAAALIDAIGDDTVTVRKVAARALVALGADALEAVKSAAENAHGVRQRELVLVLGQLETKKALKPILAALKDADTALQRDAVRALYRFDSVRAPTYLKAAGLQGIATPDGALRMPYAPPQQ